MGTTSRPPVPKGLFEECRVQYLRDIDTKMKMYSIPPELVINADQTPSSYISVGRTTMAKQGSSSVSIKGLSDKRNITLTFVVTLTGVMVEKQLLASHVVSSFLKGFVYPKIRGIGPMSKRL